MGDRYQQVLDEDGLSPLDRAWARVLAGEQRGPDALRQAVWEAGHVRGEDVGSPPFPGEPPPPAGLLPDPGGERRVWELEGGRWLWQTRPGGGLQQIDLWFYADWGRNTKLASLPPIKSRWRWEELKKAYEHGYQHQPVSSPSEVGQVSLEVLAETEVVGDPNANVPVGVEGGGEVEQIVPGF